MIVGGLGGWCCLASCAVLYMYWDQRPRAPDLGPLKLCFVEYVCAGIDGAG